MKNGERTGKELLDATRPYAREQVAVSWFHVVTTLSALVASLGLAAMAPWLALRIVASVLAGLVFVRVFILYHDHLHGALLRQSKIANALFHLVGIVMMSPVRVWSDTHNFHHAHTGKVDAPATGTYSLWTVEQWQRATPLQRLGYRAERHPLLWVFGYLTVFFFGLGVLPFVRNPKRYASSLVAVLAHVFGSIALIWSFGVVMYTLVMLVPFVLSFGLGSYLFYAQHNDEDLTLAPQGKWSYTDAALRACTYFKTGPVLEWFTGNIGYHHVHHLNARIPFYRLPEAMAAIPELQNPVVTSFHPRDVMRVMRYDLWDPARGRMVTIAEIEHESAPFRPSIAPV